MRTFPVLFCLFLFGCTPVAKLLLGYHEPRYETKESLLNYVLKAQMDKENIYIYRDTISFYRKLKEHSSLPNIEVFDKEGISIQYKDSTIPCTGAAYGFTDSICLYKSLKRNYSSELRSVLKNLTNLEGQPLDLSQLKGYDYYIIIYWATYIGRLNKNHVKVWEDNLKKNKGCTVKIFKVNMDWQQNWLTGNP